MTETVDRKTARKPLAVSPAAGGGAGAAGGAVRQAPAGCGTRPRSQPDPDRAAEHTRAGLRHAAPARPRRSPEQRRCPQRPSDAGQFLGFVVHRLRLGASDADGDRQKRRGRRSKAWTGATIRPRASRGSAKRGDPYDKVGQDPASHTAIDFGVVAAPESFLIDGNGVIRYKQPGPISAADWETKIKPLIAQLKK